MRKLTSYLLISLLFCAACVKIEQDTPGQDGQERAFVFSARLPDGEWIPLETKADASMSDLQDNANGNGWGVYAYYTGTDNYTNPGDVDGVIFNKRRVWWDGSGWQYYVDAAHKEEYWPMDEDEKVTFFAFAPWSLYQGSASVDNEKGPQVTYTASTDLAAQKDLLWGTNTSGLPHRNVNLASFLDPVSNPNGTVDFHFRHAPAKVHFTINGATLGDENGQPSAYGNANTQTNYGNLTRSTEETGQTVYASNAYRTLYWAYREKTVTTTQTYRRSVSGFKILLNKLEMTNFIKNGILHLDNPDAFMPDWEQDGDELLDYTFSPSDIPMVTAITNPGNETTLSNGWGTTYLGVNDHPQELLPTPDNYIYMVPKKADALTTDSKNITITVTYHVIGLSKTEQFTRTTTTHSWQRVPYYTRNNNYYYQQSGGNYGTDTNSLNWADFSTDARPSTSTYTDGPSTNVGTPVFNYTQDNNGLGFKAVGSINTDIIGGREYTVNLYLDGRELNLTVIPQPWDLEETLYDYDQTLNPIRQALTYDSDFVYQVVDDKVYINNRMGKFYFRLGSGKYLYWQASLIGDDAFAFTDENGQYLRDANNDFVTSIRGAIGEEMNYIYVKATNTASQVTSSAKLRIYLFDSDNHAIVALPRENWLFLNAMFTNGEDRVQEWTVIQAAN